MRAGRGHRGPLETLGWHDAQLAYGAAFRDLPRSAARLSNPALAADGGVEHPVRRTVAFEQANHDDEGVGPRDELTRAIQGVDEEYALGCSVVLPSAFWALFGDDGHVRVQVGQALADELVRAAIRLGDRIARAFVVDAERLLVDLQDLASG